ncbi:death-associated inhibitor of apoptosis 2-like [Anopheles albimanus]|uniref:RING-type domain-containing protein n=1 Tax=Anopheles albimanus TaxID=7167 RepID=A0A1I8JSI2_ANOAL|nr:death-associated inhibitor of apoptosis 2-like [Anopheles albimanus]
MQMNVEELRLRSFYRWPTAGSEDGLLASRLARDGFYATEIPFQIQCYFCGLVREDCRNVMEVVEAHRNQEPGCELLLHPDRTNNCRNFRAIELMDERNRLATFAYWPVSFIKPEELAEAGFYYTHQADEVKCAWCSGVIGRWELGDNAFQEHAKFFPGCTKVIIDSNRSDPVADTSIGILPVQLPHNQEYCTLDARMRSFENWTAGHVQDPGRLAEAGFYYLGEADEVRCFHCDGGLRLWLADDDPWFEHARCFPLCRFLQLVKGKTFVDNVQGQVARNQQTAPTVPTETSVPPVSAVDGTARNPIPAPVASRMTLDEALSTEPVQQALQMGLNIGRIRAATKRRLETMGQPFPSSQELVEVVLDDQIEEEDLEPSSSSRMERRMEAELLQWTNMGHKQSDKAVTIGAGSAPKTSEGNLATGDVNSCLAIHASEQSSSSILSDEAALRLKEENKRLKDARECKICMSDEVGVVFCPCGHLVSCVQCAPAVTNCPVCRALIRGRVRTFLS